MSEVEIKTKIEPKDELYAQYNWFYQSFLPAIQLAGNEFFSDIFSFKLVSISKNINVLFQGDDYFVTKIRVDKQHDVFFRFSADAVKIILDEILGADKEFDLTAITELEAKIISSFNDYLYSNISSFLLPAPQKDKKRKNLDTIHLTFFIRDKKTKEGAKLIVSIPQVLLAPHLVESHNENFDITAFKNCKLDVNIKVGTTKFSLKELKNLEREDLVIFENSNIHTMKLHYEDYETEFKISPNLGLITPIDNDNGGNNMEQNSLSQNLWDNIQVEMGAEFDKVKITLGELKNIEQGLVVDISSVYDNKISLIVENRTIAKGELVIVNDRYGVRIDEVFSSEKEHAQQLPQEHDEAHEEEAYEEHHAEERAEEGQSNSDEEFDYSDFELDDQDI